METHTVHGRTPGSDEEAVRALVAEAQKHQNDTSALVALHSPEAIVVNAPGRRVMGRDAFADLMKAAMTTPLSAVRTSADIVDIRFTTDDVAIVSCVKTIHDERPDDEEPTELPSTAALTYVLVRAAGSWRVALAQTTPRR